MDALSFSATVSSRLLPVATFWAASSTAAWVSPDWCAMMVRNSPAVRGCGPKKKLRRPDQSKLKPLILLYLYFSAVIRVDYPASAELFFSTALWGRSFDDA